MKILTHLILSALLSFSGSNDNQSDPVYLQSETLAQVRQFAFSQEHIAAANHQLMHIEVFDRQTGELLATFGKEGEGPGEFGGLESVAIHNSMIFGADVSNNRVVVFEMDQGHRQTLNFDFPFNLIHLTPDQRLVLLNTLIISNEEQPLITIADPENGEIIYQGFEVSEELSRFRIGSGHAWTASSDYEQLVFTHPYMYEFAVIQLGNYKLNTVNLSQKSEVYNRSDLDGFQPPQSAMSEAISAFVFLVSLQDDGLYIFSSDTEKDELYLEIYNPDSLELQSSRTWEHHRPAYIEDGVAYTVSVDSESNEDDYFYKVTPIKINRAN